MDLLKLLLLFMAAPLLAASSIHHGDTLDDHMPAGFTLSHSARMVEEGEFILSSMDAHDNTDLDALLSFKKSITSDPSGLLSNWTAENSESMCSWYGIRCKKHTRRVLHIDLSWYALQSTHWFKGTLSPSVGNLSLLRTFNISGQDLAGRIPREFGKLKSLQVLDLSYNGIEGSIPVELGLLHKLRSLNLSENYPLTGGIPPELGQLKALRVLDLSQTRIEGSIPVELGELKALRVLDLSLNMLNGSIPVELGLLHKLESLLLEGNEFSGNIPRQLGEIPSNIGSMSILRLLNLSGNQLEGQIPASLSWISSLEQLDLSKNNLSGIIPEVLSKLSMLASFNVSFNNLCGTIPMGTQFSTFNVTAFDKNECLCGFPLPACTQKDKPKNRSNAKRGWLSYVDEEMSLIALALGLGIGFGGVVAMFIVWDKARHWVMGVPSKSTRRPFYGVYQFPT